MHRWFRCVGRWRIPCIALLGVLATCVDDRAPTSPRPSTAAVAAPLEATVTQTLLTSGSSPTNQKVYTTAPIAPAPEALITIAVLSHISSTVAAAPVVSGGGLSAWNQVATVSFDGVASSHKRLTVYRAMGGSSGSGPVTITFSKAQSNCQWIVSQWQNVDVSGSNGAGAIGQMGSNSGDGVSGLPIVLSPFANSGNVAYGVFGVNRNALAVSPGTGFTEIAEQPSGENTAADLEAEWATNLNTIEASWSALNGGALGFEIKAGGAPVPVASVEITPSLASVPEGGALQLAATPRDASGNPLNGRAVTWESRNAAVATVDAGGLVTAISLGTATITATSEAVTGTATVTVIVPVAKVEITPSVASIEIGATVQLAATPQDADGNPLTDRAVTWSSSALSVATINTTGLVTGVGEGSATISATSEGRSGTATVTVLPLPGSAAILVGAGDIARCSADGDEATATLLDNIPGSVFTAGDNAYPDGSPTDFSQCYDPSWGRHRARTRPSPGNHDYDTPGASAYFAYYGALAGAPGIGYYSYDLGDWHIVSLNSNISMSAGSPQEQWLRADLAASTRQCTIAYWHHPRFTSGTHHGSTSSAQPLWQALYDAGAEIVISGHEHNYERFAPQTPDGIAAPAFGIREFVVGTGGGSLYNDQVTPLANSEVFNGTTYGVLKLTLASGSYQWEFIPVAGGTFSDAGSGTCHGRPEIPVASVTIAPTEASTAIGGTIQFTATPLDSVGHPLSGKAVTWASSDPGVAVVTDAGLATGVGVGSATITATSEGKSASAAILVASVPVATVDVTPPSVALQVGATSQLSATPRDALGNPLSSRIVTWSSSDPTVALVDGVGLVTGAREGSATVSATSEGHSGSSTITVTAQPACLDRTGSLLTLSGVQTVVFDNRELVEATRIDASTSQFLTGASKAIRVGGGARSCLRGGEIIGQLPPATDWATMHGTYALQVEGIPFFTLEGMHEFDYGDGITLSDSSRSWLIKGVYFKYMRDDCVQNDWLNSGTIDSSLFDGCSTGFSSRPYATTVDGSANLVVVKNSLFRLQDMDQGYVVPGHGGFFKWAETGPMVSLYNNVYRADSPSDLGGHTLGPPAGKLKDCANNVMIWLGSGPFPESLPACYTLLTGAAGVAYWDNAVATWKANHPTALADIGPPIVSIFTPAEGTSLEGIVTLTATAVDDRDVTGVQFRIDGVDVGSEVTIESPLTKFSRSWDSRGEANGTHVLTAVARDATGNTTVSAGIAVTIVNGAGTLSTVTASPDTVPAGDNASTITVTVLDVSGVPMGGVSVTLSATGSGNTIVQPAATGADGVTTGRLSSTVAGSKTVTAVAGGVAVSQHPVVTVIAATADGAHSMVNANPTTIAAGSGASTITVTVRDQFDNPVGGATVELAASGIGNTLTQPGPTNALGVTNGTLTSTDAETKTVSAKANGVAIGETASVTVTAQGPPATITHRLLTSGHEIANQRIYITGSISPAANTLVTVAVLTHQSSAAAPSPSLSGGGMTSWELVATVAYDGATPLDRLTIYRAMSPAPGSGPITISSNATVSNCQWIVSQWSGVDVSGTNGSGAIVQAASASGTGVTSLIVALGDFAGASNVAYGAFGVATNIASVTPGSGFTTIDQQPSGESTIGDLFAEWAVLSREVTATWLSKNAGALGVEIRAGTGP